MDAHERDVTLEALTAAISGINEVTTAENVRWSVAERQTLAEAFAVLSHARRGLWMVEAG